jgi:serine protease Do
MNSKRILTALGLSALTVALVAIPGTSARRQDPSPTSAQDLAQRTAAAVKVYQDAGQLHVGSDLENDLALQDVDDDVQVIVSGHGWLGAGVSEVTPDKVKEFKLPAERGVVLGKIVPDSPAAKAGLKENDVVTEINGQRVEGTEQFRRMIREIPGGRTAQLTVWRDGRAQTVAVNVGKSEPHMTSSMIAPGTFALNMPDMSHLNELMEANPWFGGHPRLGIDAEDLEGDFGKYFGAPDGEGVLVRGVFSDSPAAKAGLKVGDVITSVNGDRVHSVGELREKLTEKRDEKSIQLGLLRNKAPLTLSVELPAPEEKHEPHNSVRTSI